MTLCTLCYLRYPALHLISFVWDFRCLSFEEVSKILGLLPTISCILDLSLACFRKTSKDCIAEINTVIQQMEFSSTLLKKSLLDWPILTRVHWGRFTSASMEELQWKIIYSWHLTPGTLVHIFFQVLERLLKKSFLLIWGGLQFLGRKVPSLNKEWTASQSWAYCIYLQGQTSGLKLRHIFSHFSS